MEAPPPYMPPRKKSNTGLIVGIIIGAVVLCCMVPIGLLVGGGFWIFNKGKEIIQCSSAFRDARDGLRMYAADHNGKLPPAETWQDDTISYYQKAVDRTSAEDRKVLGSMAANGPWGCADGSGGITGIAINEDVAGKDLTKVESANDIVLFEVRKSTRNAHEKYEALPLTESPKLVGSPRGWFLIRMNGESMLRTKQGTEKAVGTTPGGD